jgi:hypothetical protein
LKKLKKVLLYFALATGVILISITISVFLFQDRIIQRFVREANKSLNTPVRIGKIDISAWRDFPNLAITFSDVYIEDSQAGDYPLLTAKTISFYLNPIEAWRGNYSIRGLKITDSETNLKIDPHGTTNYDIVKESRTDGSQIVFDLKNVILRNSRVSYHDQQAHLHHIFDSEHLVASISLHNNVYHIEGKGDVTIDQIGVKERIFLKDKRVGVTANLQYDVAAKNLIIDASSLSVNKSDFEVKGSWSFRDPSVIDIAAEGKETNFQRLLTLMPDDVVHDLKKYRSEGEVYFSMSLKGEISDRKSPFMSIKFGCKDARFFHPDYKSTIEHASFEGSFACPSLTSLSGASLFLKNMTGELNQKAFQANFSVENMDDPLVALDFKGDLDASSLLIFYPIPEIKTLEGNIRADISFNGRIALLRKKSTAQQVKASGSIEMHAVQVMLTRQNINLRDLEGSLQFNNNDLALSDVRGKFGNSDFKLNGFFKNVITFLLFDNQPIGIETDLKSNFLDLDQLFALGFGEKGSGEFNFHLSPDLHLNFNCDVKGMKYRRFRAAGMKGDLLVKNQMAVSRNITLHTMGGDVTINGIIDAKNPKAIEVVSSSKLKGVHLDSLFYIFENFHQGFIESKHLKGQTYADVSLEMVLNEKLNLFPETLIADIDVTLRNGELNNFEPMRKLNHYLDDEGLSHLRFGDLENDIHIEKKTIYIPQMEIQSNVTNIQLSGTHTFDQHIDYHVVAPFHSRKKIDKDEAFGAVENDDSGHPRVFLKITGTTDDYTVSYDKAAVKKKIVSDLKKEVLELKDAFKTKGKKKKKELELEKEEYFDWDDHKDPIP